MEAMQEMEEKIKEYNKSIDEALAVLRTCVKEEQEES